MLNPTEEQGLFFPKETIEKMINQIRNKTLVDDHETIIVFTLRTKAVLERKYKWKGDDYFRQLRDEVLYFWRMTMNSTEVYETTPDFMLQMGRLLACIHQLSQFLIDNGWEE